MKAVAKYSALKCAALVIAGSLMGGFVHADDALQARDRIEVNDTPDGVWEKIGDFCAIADWHPAVATCEVSENEGDTLRTLTLADGAQIVEKLLGPGPTPTSYQYAILEGPLPVKDYVATLEVSEDDDGGAGIKWSAEFMAEGASDDEAVEIIEGIFAAGLESVEALY